MAKFFRTSSSSSIPPSCSIDLSTITACNPAEHAASASRKQISQYMLTLSLPVYYNSIPPSCSIDLSTITACNPAEHAASASRKQISQYMLTLSLPVYYNSIPPSCSIDLSTITACNPAEQAASASRKQISQCVLTLSPVLSHLLVLLIYQQSLLVIRLSKLPRPLENKSVSVC